MTRTASEGRACDRCRATEARCAWLSECCAACTHWTGYDAAGNDKPKPLLTLAERPICGNCGRRVGIRGRLDCPGLCIATNRGYDRARSRRRKAVV